MLNNDGYCPNCQVEHCFGECPSTLGQAIKHLGAVEVAPGRYAVKNTVNSVKVWFIHNTYAIRNLQHGIWCGGVAMPAWWTPERRILTRVRSESITVGSRKRQAVSYEVTVDLETGEEVPVCHWHNGEKNSSMSNYISDKDPCPGAKDHKHRWGLVGCKCHQYCNNCTTQRETPKKGKA